MIKKFYLVVKFVCNDLLKFFFCFKKGAFYRELIMSFNFSHPQKSGWAMAHMPMRALGGVSGGCATPLRLKNTKKRPP